MTVKFVTHSLTTHDITLMGQVNDVATVKGSKISRVGAVEGQEQQNPASIHLNFEVTNNPDDMFVIMLSSTDAVEIGLQMVAMALEEQPKPNVNAIRDRISQLIAELDRTLQVSH
ncbi:MAG: hypothetical protein ACTS2F_12455 [Thainema sp.]